MTMLMAHLSFFSIFFLYTLTIKTTEGFWHLSPLFFSSRINYSAFLILGILYLILLIILETLPPVLVSDFHIVKDSLLFLCI